VAAAVFAALALALNVSTRESSASYAAELDFYRGMEQKTYRRDMPGAADLLRRATQEDPNDGRFWFELGNVLDALRRRDEAIDAWKRAGEVDPWDARARRRAAFVLGQRGEIAEAIALHRANVDGGTREASYYAPDHLSLALLYAKQHDPDRAVEELERAHDADPVWFRSNVAGFARAARGDPDARGDRFVRALEAYLR
jgi:tetratricopeptide (TPR) repeat protein